MRLVAVEGPWIYWDVFGDEHHWKVFHVIKNLRDFIVRKMLENLADQAQIRRRQRVAGDVGEAEANVWKVYPLDVMCDQFRDHVDADVVYSRCLDDLSADDEVSAAEIDHTSNPVIPDELDNSVAVLL